MAMATSPSNAEAKELALTIGSTAADAVFFAADLDEELPLTAPLLLSTLSSTDEKVETDRSNRQELIELQERRPSGFQTISKDEYTTMCVPTARLNPKTHRWEPVDGYEVDMSGFGSEDSDGDDGDEDRDGCSGGKENDSHSHSEPRMAAMGGSDGGEAGEGEEDAGTKTRDKRTGPLVRDPSRTSMSRSLGTSSRSWRPRTLEDRLVAFQLGPKALEHLERSERAHDEAMTSFLGKQAYARAKVEGAARLLRLPGVASIAAEDASFSRKLDQSKRGTGGGSCSGSSDTTSGEFRGTEGRRKDAAAATSGGAGDGRCETPSSRGKAESACSAPSTKGPSGGGSCGGGRRRPSARPAIKGPSLSPARIRGSAGRTAASGSARSTPLWGRRLSGASGAKWISPAQARAGTGLTARTTPGRTSPRASSRRGASSFVSPKPAERRGDRGDEGATVAVGGRSLGSSRQVSGRHSRHSRHSGSDCKISASSSHASSPDHARRSNNSSSSRRLESFARTATTPQDIPDTVENSDPQRRDAPGSSPQQQKQQQQRNRRSDDGTTSPLAATATTATGGVSHSAASPRPFSRVVRTPPRRGLGGERGGTIVPPPMSPRVVRLQRIALLSGRSASWQLTGSSLAGGSGGVVGSARRGGARGLGGGRKMSAEAAAEAEREKAARRLERFRYMAEFASNTVKERFSLFGERTSMEVPFTGDFRRGHRRRRSGGESSTGGVSVGSGSSAGLGSMVGLTTVW